jgi:uncharacterized membrane protein
MRDAHVDRVDRVPRRYVALGLVLLGFVGLFVTAIVLLVAQNSGLPFSESPMSYWNALLPSVPTASCFIAAAFVFAWPTRSISN